jgi:hypothetical protein
MIANHILLYLLHLIIFIVGYFDRNLIGIIVEIDKAIVQEEPAVALLPIAIIHLLPTLDVI